MTNMQINSYLAKMAEMSFQDWVLDRNGKLKAIDELRLFYLSMYQAKQEVSA